MLQTLGKAIRLQLYTSKALAYLSVFSFSIFWRIFGIGRESLHVDEQIQAVLVSPSLLATWNNSRFLGMPPLDMTLEWFVVKIIGLENFTIRITPVLFGALSCTFFAMTISRLSKLSLGVFGGILAAVTPSLIFQQQTARPYSLYIFLIVSIFYFSTGTSRPDRMWMIFLLTCLPWSRALEGPVSSIFLIVLFSSTIFLRKHLRSKAWHEAKIFFIPLASCLYSLIWIKNTKNTIIGPPGSYLNSWTEFLSKFIGFPDFLFSLLKVLLSSEFIMVNLLLTLIAIGVSLIRSRTRSDRSKKSNLPLTNSLFSFVIWNFCNSLIIFLAFYCLTKLQYFDRYFSLGIIGWLGITVLLTHYISQSDLRFARLISYTAIISLLFHFTLVSYSQAIKVDKVQFDQVNKFLISHSLVNADQVIVYQPGDINQYLPGWPVSIGSTMVNTPNWVSYVVKRIYLDKELNVIQEGNFSTLVLLPSVDARSNLLIGRPWEENLFKGFLPTSKITFIPGGAYVLENLTNSQMLTAFNIVMRKYPDSSNLWLSSYALALAKFSKIPASSVLTEIFCNLVNAKTEIVQGTSFGLWGKPSIPSATLFREPVETNCRKV